LLAGLLLTTAAAHAQFGGLLKGAGEAIKKGAPQAKPPSGEPTPTTLGCPVDRAAMDRLMKALEAQHAGREAALKEAAAAKTQAQYDACLEDVAFSPEFDKIMASFDPVNPAGSEAAAKALNLTKCGPPPNEAWQQWRSHFNAATMSSSKCDAVMLEFAVPFCTLPPSQQSSAQTAGIQVPGEFGKGFYIYTAAEATTFAPYCARLMSLMNAENAHQKQYKQYQALSQ
jgi:hypothetical protein